MVRIALALLALCACDSGGMRHQPDPKYPSAQCSELHVAPRDPAAYVDPDWAQALFVDEREAWKSARCDATRRALRPIGDAHDLEDATVKRECDEASHGDLACRAGCFAERKHDAAVIAWSRALGALRSFTPRRDLEAFMKACPIEPGEDRSRTFLRCAHGPQPLPPKSFRVEVQRRLVYTYEGHSESTRTIGLDYVQISHRDGMREHTITLQECGGSGSRWDVFERPEAR
jgi:hypothetical protein